MDKLRIDIVSDVVCPWCVIGYRQLVAASEQTGVPIDVHWHPFELNPNMAPEGENLREHLAAKYGTTKEESVAARERLTALGGSLGFTFDYADDMRMYNTFNAHQLLHWAEQESQEAGHQLKQALFEAFFTHRKDVSDPAVLVEVAESIGLDGKAATTILETQEFAEAVRAAEYSWQLRGIQGVPAVILDNKYLMSGAQGEERFAAGLKQAAAEAAD